jgi:hypothetical protein
VADEVSRLFPRHRIAWGRSCLPAIGHHPAVREILDPPAVRVGLRHISIHVGRHAGRWVQQRIQRPQEQESHFLAANDAVRAVPRPAAPGGRRTRRGTRPSAGLPARQSRQVRSPTLAAPSATTTTPRIQIVPPPGAVGASPEMSRAEEHLLVIGRGEPPEPRPAAGLAAQAGQGPRECHPSWAPDAPVEPERSGALGLRRAHKRDGLPPAHADYSLGEDGAAFQWLDQACQRGTEERPARNVRAGGTSRAQSRSLSPGSVSSLSSSSSSSPSTGRK